MNLVLQIFLWTITIISAIIAYHFYKSKDGRLRILVIELFLAKIFVYGGAALYYLFGQNKYPELIRMLLNLPMFIVMLKLWAFIRTDNKRKKI